MRLMTLLTATFWLGGGLAALADDPAPKTPDYSSLRALLQQAVNDGELPGVAVRLVHQGNVVFEEAFGNLTTASVVRMASDTKPVAATTVLTVVEEGKLALDDPITKYVPEFQGTKVETATIRQLLSHTGGILGVYPGGRPTSGTLAEFARKIAREGTLVEPGTFHYSGVSIDIACRAAEAAAGRPFEDLMRSRLLEPLGMTQTRFTMAVDPASVPVDAAQRGEGRYVSGGGGLSSTLADYAAFYQMHLNGGTFQSRRILKAETAALMRTPQPNAVNPRYAESGSQSPWGPDYGLGFYLTRKDDSGRPRTFHHGGALGTMAWADTDLNLVGVFLSQVPLAKARPLIERVQAQARRPWLPQDETIAARGDQPGSRAGLAQRKGLAGRLAARAKAAGSEGIRPGDPEAVFKAMAEGKDKVARDRFEAFFKDRFPRLGERPEILGRLFDRLDENLDSGLSLNEFQNLRKVLEGLGAGRRPGAAGLPGRPPRPAEPPVPPGP
jgi:CubicO group peptidase (beta-lactamase class C family)